MEHPPPASPSSLAEATAWIDVLLRYGLLHTAVLSPRGAWLVQLRPHDTVWLLRDTDDVLTLAAALQEHLHAADTGETR